MASKHHSLFSSAQVGELDRCAIVDHRVPATVLMKRAGKAAFDALLAQWPKTTSVYIFCGGGNNGGDGYVIAALAAQRGLLSHVWQLSSQLKGAAKSAYEYAIQEGVKIESFDSARLSKSMSNGMSKGLFGNNGSAVLVDALLGTGSDGPPRDTYRAAIDVINQSGLPVLSVDIPSGLNPDNGTVDDIAVKAQLTISFIGQKLGNVVGEGRVHSGKRLFNDLHVPKEIYKQQALAESLNLHALLALISSRKLDSHKGDFGHVLVVGGDHGYGGAPLMAAQMAARSGAGLVGVATQPDNTHAIISCQPELMAAGVVSGQELLPLLDKPTVLVVGPGLGQSAWSEQLLYHCLHAAKPMVVDADGLNLIAQGRLQFPTLGGVTAIHQPQSAEWISTPHPGEAARLLNTTIESIQADRVAAIYALQEKLGGAVVLKGAGSLVLTSDQRLFVCDAGNPGMASGGMGDVLSGLLGALLAQGLSIDSAACLGVILHASAADIAAAEAGQHGLLATDLIPYVRQLLNEY
ncbi:MAG: NAD(P)H-hydrate epimerase [Cellvibrionaceae bacterium]|jgi:NAD(P)H-hydrate epimerase